MALHRRSRCEKSKGYLKVKKGKSFKCPESVKVESDSRYREGVFHVGATFIPNCGTRAGG